MTFWRVNSKFETTRINEFTIPSTALLHGLGLDDKFAVVVLGTRPKFDIQIRSTKDLGLIVHSISYWTHFFSGFHYEAGYIAAGSDDGKIR